MIVIVRIRSVYVCGEVRGLKGPKLLFDGKIKSKY